MLYLHELHRPKSFGKQVDQMICSEDFFKFGMGEVPQCCISISGINMENAKQVAIFSDSCKDIMLDTGANRDVTFFKDDFISFKYCYKKKKVIKGIAKGLKIKGSGTVEYQFNADDNSVIVHQCESFYVPDMHMRLLLPQDAGTSTGNPV
eukprot:8517562-Ditylum_brightwellii.AAC.1